MTTIVMKIMEVGKIVRKRTIVSRWRVSGLGFGFRISEHPCGGRLPI